MQKDVLTKFYYIEISARKKMEKSVSRGAWKD